MRAALVVSLVLAAAPARADDGALDTGAWHQFVWTPPTALPVRGPRFAPVTIDAYVALGHAPSYATAELARRAVERAGDVREVLHLSATATAEPVVEALVEAVEQGRFYALFDKLVQTRPTFTTPIDLVHLAREAGLDGERMAEALASHRHRGDAERLQRDSHVVGHHPPELLVNGRRLSPWSGDEAIAHAIGEARARADELLAEGVPLGQLYERILELDEEVPFVLDPLSRGSRRRLTIDLAGAPARGAATAPVTVVLWANFACMQCAEVAAALKKLGDARPGLVRVVWKHFPTTYRDVAQRAAEYAAAAELQGRFWELHDLAMSSHLAPSRLTKSELDRLAAQAGLDEARLRSDLDGGHARAVVERDTEEARRLGVPTAGSVAVDGLPVAGAPSYETLERLVAAELDAGVLERLRR